MSVWIQSKRGGIWSDECPSKPGLAHSARPQIVCATPFLLRQTTIRVSLTLTFFVDRLIDMSPTSRDASLPWDLAKRSCAKESGDACYKPLSKRWSDTKAMKASIWLFRQLHLHFWLVKYIFNACKLLICLESILSKHNFCLHFVTSNHTEMIKTDL